MTASTLRPGCRSLLSSLMLLALMLGGCASQASHLTSDLATVKSVCQQHTYKTQIELVNCFGSNERPVVTKDLPGILHSYDIWHSARVAAAYDYDNKVTLAKKDAQAAYSAAAADNRRKLYIALAPVWARTQLEEDAVKLEADRTVNAACKRDGLFISASFVVDLKCQRDAWAAVIERKVPAASNGFHEYWDTMLASAAIYDGSVLPVIQKAAADFIKAVKPARDAFGSEVQAALQADAAETARQREEAADLLAGLALGLLVGYVGAANSAAPPIISTSCTTINRVTNCLSY